MHRAAGHVGVDLHQQRILLGDAAGADDPVDSHAVFPNALDDRARAERRRLDQRAIDLGARRIEVLPDQQAGQQLIDEDGPVAVVPVERQQAGLARLLPRRLGGQLLVQRGVAAADALDPPLEDVADRRLSGLDAEVARAGSRP